MTLSALIRGTRKVANPEEEVATRGARNFATAIPAIPATQPEGEETTVAKIATVAVANPKEAQTQLAPEPPKPEPRLSWSDYTPASEGELARMAARTEAFERMGLTFDEIDLVVDRLLRRDREGDDRHLCIECQHVRGSATGWRCDALRGAIPPDWVTIRLQRCPTFSAS
jgi:hypothetical protein